MLYLKIYGAMALTFFAIDMVWLGWVGKQIYQKQIGQWLSPQPDWVAAGLFYLLFLAGMLYFAVMPSLEGSGTDALIRGAAFGLITYATYELTNKAVHVDWPWTIVWIDILWGMVLSGLTTWVGWRIGK